MKKITREYKINKAGIETEKGTYLCVEWTDSETGGTYRAYAKSLILNDFEDDSLPFYGVKETLGTDGLWISNEDSRFKRVANNNTFVNETTGAKELEPYVDPKAEEKVLKENIVTNRDYLINLIGFSSYENKAGLLLVLQNSVKEHFGLV